jgi:hypothetical protein
MTDIVQRLRQDFTTEPIPLHAEAAAEIERLRTVLRETVEHLIECEADLDRFHGLGVDAGSGSSIVVISAQQAIAKSEGK